MTPTRGSHGKLHRTTKILSHARRRGGGVAARGARAAADYARDRLSSQRIVLFVCTSRGRIPGGLKETGYVEGRNVAIDFRWAEGRYNQLPALAADLVSGHVAVIVAQGGDPPPLAAKSATSTIPIVFTISSDPVQLGLVDSLNRPGGNATGFWAFTSLLGTKRLELMQQLLPAKTLIGVLVNPNNPNAHIDTTQLHDAARTLGQSIILVRASTEAEIDAVFVALSDQRVSALLVNTDPFFLARRDQFVSLAARNGLPAIYAQREFVAVGGLISYGASLADGYHQVGVYAGRVLKGEKPADLPVVQPTKFEFVINLRTAKALGLDVPPTLLARADEVIE
jgi:putative tryptophan/tyrosine transport system substrate-binding protein